MTQAGSARFDSDTGILHPAWARRRPWWRRPAPWPAGRGRTDALINDPVCRAAGTRGGRRLLLPPGHRRAAARAISTMTPDHGHAAVDRHDGGPHEILRRVLPGATRAGIRQAVILASGLDSRAYRLAWPAGTTVYESTSLDVIEFKTGTLAGLGADADGGPPRGGDRSARRLAGRTERAGFDPTQPTAWIAEGLLGYLPARGPGPSARPGHRAERAGQPVCHRGPASKSTNSTSRSCAGACGADRRCGPATASSSTWPSLVYFGERNEAADYLADHGWRIIRHEHQRPGRRHTACRRSTTTTWCSAKSSMSRPN